jgi:hypothetical protein
MNKLFLVSIAMLFGGSAAAADVIAPPVLKYQTDIPSIPRPVIDMSKRGVPAAASNAEISKRAAVNVTLLMRGPF